MDALINALNDAFSEAQQVLFESVVQPFLRTLYRHPRQTYRNEEDQAPYAHAFRAQGY